MNGGDGRMVVKAGKEKMEGGERRVEEKVGSRKE